MSKRARIVTFGAAGLLVLAGSALAALVSGGTGQIVAMALIGVGLVAVVGLLFFEVGLSEDAERAREQRRSQTRAHPPESVRGRSAGRRVKPRLARSRGQRRRLRRDGE